MDGWIRSNNNQNYRSSTNCIHICWSSLHHWLSNAKFSSHLETAPKRGTLWYKACSIHRQSWDLKGGFKPISYIFGFGIHLGGFLFGLFCVFWSGPFSSNLLCLCFVKQLVMKLIDCLHAYRPKVHEDSAAFYMSGSCQVILKLDEPPFPKAPFNWVVLKLTVTSGQIMAKLQILQTASSNH